jgi:hypothetical protein
MKRHFLLAFLILGLGCGLRAQVTDTTVCDIVKKPASFDGKIVRIKGTVFAGFDEFAIKDAADPNCGFQVDAIWLSYPTGTKGKAGPAAMITVQPAHNFAGTYKAPSRTPVTLEKDKNFKQFDSLLAQTHQKGADMCLGCTRYEVTATLVGRLDGVADGTLKRDGGKIVGFGGFGNMNAYPARLVLQSVSDITPKEVDFSKTDDVTKGDAMAAQQPQAGPEFSDPLAAAQKLAAAMGSDQAGNQIKRAVAALPKPKEQNGVNIAYNLTNEDSPADQALGPRDSPDGILFNISFNREHLPGDALTRAVIHMGEHVADLRTPTAGDEDAPPYILENDAWVMTAISAVVSGQKYLTLPGAYLLWNVGWPAADRNDKMAAGLKDFLINEARLSR